MSEPSNNRHKQSVVIDSDTAQGQRVQSEILALAHACAFTEPELFAIRLAVEEALVNAIKHGNQSDPRKKVRIDFEVSHDELLVRIEDEGDGFDPLSVPDPTAPENLERPCGRGLMLMRHYMSSVEFSRRGNCVQLLKRRGHSPPSDED